MKKVTLLLLLAFVFAAGSVLAQNSGHRGFNGSKGGPKVQKKMQHSEMPFGHPSLSDVTRAREELKLSDEQVAKLKSIHYDFRMAQVDRRAEISKARIELGRLKMDQSSSEQAVLKAIDNLSRAQAEVEKAQYKYTKSLQSVLSEEQLKKWQEFRKDNRHEMRGNMNQRGPRSFGQWKNGDDDWDDDNGNDEDNDGHDDEWDDQ